MAGMGLIITAIFFVLFFSLGTPPKAEDINWGVNFSRKHAEYLGLDWEETYLAILNDLGAKRIKLITHWDQIEPNKSDYQFEALDWEIEKAKEREAELLLTIGMKTPRWPECHIPDWAINLTKEEQQAHILQLIEEIVLRYSGENHIWAWQVENEPFFPFGECPWADKDFLNKEVALVKKLDTKSRPVVISDSGEGSLWWSAARAGDIVATTLYKKVWVRQINAYIHYPMRGIFYWRKAQIVKKLFDTKVICAELQAEPWGPKLLYDSPLEEQAKTMNPEQFKKMVDFASGTGFDEFYLWGTEWWYWMKEKHNDPRIWDIAKTLF